MDAASRRRAHGDPVLPGHLEALAAQERLSSEDRRVLAESLARTEARASREAAERPAAAAVKRLSAEERRILDGCLARVEARRLGVRLRDPDRPRASTPRRGVETRSARSRPRLGELETRGPGSR